MTGAPLRLSVIGLTGSGKSTFASLVEEEAARLGRSHARVKLAEPLYHLQRRVYEAAGVPLAPGAQDQELMEALATALRRINARSLVDDFRRRLAATAADVVVNDDLRDPHVDAVVLRREGFRIVRVRAEEPLRQARLAGRADLTRAERSTGELELIEPDVSVDNNDDLAALRRRARDLIGGWS